MAKDKSEKLGEADTPSSFAFRSQKRIGVVVQTVVRGAPLEAEWRLELSVIMVRLTFYFNLLIIFFILFIVVARIFLPRVDIR